jgi:hypothetical protein
MPRDPAEFILIEGDSENPDPDIFDPLFPQDPGPLNPETVPPEEYLVGNRLAASFVSLLVAPGAVGKTTFQLLQAVAAVTRRNLTGEPIHKRCRVWFLSNEEPIDVLRRRLWAICQLYQIDYEQEVRPRLFLNSTVTQETPFRVATIENGSTLCSPDVAKVIRFAKKLKIDLLVVDPFLTTHPFGENDNTAIGFAARQFAHIAASAPCAVELAHHVVKDEDSEAHVGNIARARGAGSLVTSVRYSYTLAKPNDKTAKDLSMNDDERRRLVRLDMGEKCNYVLGGGLISWFWLESIELPNAMEGRKASNVGVPILYSLEGRTPAVDPAEAARLKRVRDLLIANVPDETGCVTLTQLIAVVQQVAAAEPKFLDATSKNSVRDLIADAIPEAPNGLDISVGTNTVRLYRRKVNPKQPNSAVMVWKETLKG